MARSVNQKLKLLYMKQFFEDKTDENHGASVKDIIAYLGENGVEAERKSIYTDLAALENYGMVIRELKDEDDGIKHRYKKYQLLERDFELKEVKLICDSIASSKFLSERMSNALIKNLVLLSASTSGRKYDGRFASLDVQRP